MMIALIAAAWLGAMGIFVATVSPTVFQTLSMPDASRFLRAYFPKLFRIEMIVGVAILFAASISDERTATAIGALIVVMASVNYWVLTDRINQIADALALDPDNPALKRRFGLMHGLSAGLFAIGGLGCLWITGYTLWEIM